MSSSVSCRHLARRRSARVQGRGLVGSRHFVARKRDFHGLPALYRTAVVTLAFSFESLADLSPPFPCSLLFHRFSIFFLPLLRGDAAKFNLDTLRESVFPRRGRLVNRAAGYTLVYRGDLLQISISGMRPRGCCICMHGPRSPATGAPRSQISWHFCANYWHFAGSQPRRISGGLNEHRGIMRSPPLCSAGSSLFERDAGAGRSVGVVTPPLGNRRTGDFSSAETMWLY